MTEPFDVTPLVIPAARDECVSAGEPRPVKPLKFFTGKEEAAA